MSDAPTNAPPRLEALQALLWQAARDLAEGHNTPTQANRITKQVGRDLRDIEALLRAAKIGQKLSEL
jgi:hypothetical protein